MNWKQFNVVQRSKSRSWRRGLAWARREYSVREWSGGRRHRRVGGFTSASRVGDSLLVTNRDDFRSPHKIREVN